MIDKCSNDGIRTSSCPNCTLCGVRGELLYQDLNDHLFGVPGKWNLKRCLNPVCGLIWLDPMPLEEDIGKAYINYHTHNDQKEDRSTVLTHLFALVKKGYWAKEYGYHRNGLRWWKRLLGNLMYLHPLRRARNDIEAMYLPAYSDGHLLDIGCGSGELLRHMQDMGWQVEGIDFDPKAIENAKKKGLTVHLGCLEKQNYPGDHFDAITMKHVIEHLHSPLQVLRECYRILKPGARLMVETPNLQSLGHRLFKQNWRGLEPPRHLHLVNRTVLKEMAREAGFEVTSIRTFITTDYILYQSYALSRNATSRNGEFELGQLESMIPKILTAMEVVFLFVNHNAGENLILIAQKPK